MKSYQAKQGLVPKNIVLTTCETGLDQICISLLRLYLEGIYLFQQLAATNYLFYHLLALDYLFQNYPPGD